MSPDRKPRLLAWAAAAVLATAALFTGCGGSGGVDTGGTGVAPETFAQGPVAGFGSIVVGGVHYDEGGAAIVDEDGAMLSSSVLALGVTTRIDAGAVTTNGARLESVASKVQVLQAIVGPVSARDAVASTLTVLGQRVQVTPTTVFDASFGGGLAAVPLNSVVSVYGQFDPSRNRTVATRIAPRPAAAAYVVRGGVSALDRAAARLSIGTLTIDIGTLALPASLAVGDVVRVKLRTTAAATGVWSATDLAADGLRLPMRDNIELEGRVTQYTSAQSFAVDGVPVDASAASFPSGSTGLALGARVEVEGRSNAGVLVARTVRLKSDDAAEDIELQGTISAANASAQTFVVQGVTVAWNASTVFQSSRASDIVNGRRVQARGRLGADRSTVIATTVQVEL